MLFKQTCKVNENDLIVAWGWSGVKGDEKTQLEAVFFWGVFNGLFFCIGEDFFWDETDAMLCEFVPNISL